MPDAMPNALSHWSDISAQLKGRDLVVLLDYDGTLTPIVPRPELAVLSGDMRMTLVNLSVIFPTAIISGRACADVRERVKVPGLFYAGNHGLELEGPDGVSLQPPLREPYRRDIQRCATHIGDALAHIQGCLIENKGPSLSVHYRLVTADDIAEVETTVDRLMEQFPRLEKRCGKKVFEIRPRIGCDKGRAVGRLLKFLKAERLTAIYIGDDTTDEDAFRALLERGIGIRVGRPCTKSTAKYCLSDVTEVHRFLENLIALARPA